MYANSLNQLMSFIIFVFQGFLIGIVFDIFRILRKSFKTPDIITNIEDVCFWILACFIILFSFLRFNNGELRLYIFASEILGIIIYMIYISKHFININVKVIKLIKKVLIIIFYPLKVLFKFFRKVFIKPISFIFINLRIFSTKKINNLKNKSKTMKKELKKEGI